jgi:hypothetical protein
VCHPRGVIGGRAAHDATRAKTACRLALALCACAPWLSALPVRADAIDPPPACPPGTRGRTSHAGQWCEAQPCAVDADCAPRNAVDRILQPGPSRCRPWRVCVRTADVARGGDYGNAPHHAEDLVVGSCDPSAACDGTERPQPPTHGTFRPGAPVCTVASYRVPDTPPPLPPRAPGASAHAQPSVASAHAQPSGATDPAPPASAGCAITTARRSSIVVALLSIALALVARRRR